MMVEESVSDIAVARRKAAGRVGVHDHRQWPSNAEVQEALYRQQLLFRPGQPAHLRELRQQALRAMRVFVRFRPRLVGSVLDGSADRGSPICLHLFADAPEDVVHLLLQQGIPWDERERLLRFSGGVRKTYPLFGFLAGNTPIELVVLPSQGMSVPPLDPVSEKPERGASYEQVHALLESTAGTEDYLREMGV
jgi:predicted nucleotidyltransferase